MNKKGCFSAGSILIGIVVLVALIALYAIPVRNNMEKMNVEVNEKWSNVETVYQKRANLIPNLERTLKSYTKYEGETLTKVVEARAKATSVTVDPANMTEQDMQRFQQAQGELSGSLSRLMAVVENYPNLKADAQYTSFVREYNAIENSIRAETVNYNEAVKQYNNMVVTFPNNIIAGLTNNHTKPFFKAEAGASKAPEVFNEN